MRLKRQYVTDACVCVCVCVYERETDRERDREKERKRAYVSSVCLYIHTYINTCIHTYIHTYVKSDIYYVRKYMQDTYGVASRGAAPAAGFTDRAP